MSERKTTLKLLGVLAFIALVFALVAGCQSGANQGQQVGGPQGSAVSSTNTTATTIVGPKVLHFWSSG